MGWTYGWNSQSELKKYILKEALKSERVLAHKSTNYGRHLWVVYQTENERFILLFLLSKNGADSCGVWGYKDLSESCHPYYYDCPLDFLEMVPEGCAEWRAEVRNLAARRNTEYNEGDSVTVYGKPYKVIGKIKKSYKIVSPAGKIYKCSSEKMQAAV